MRGEIRISWVYDFDQAEGIVAVTGLDFGLALTPDEAIQLAEKIVRTARECQTEAHYAGAMIESGASPATVRSTLSAREKARLNHILPIAPITAAGPATTPEEWW